MYATPRRRLSVHKKPHRTGGRQEKSRAVPRRGMRSARLNNEIVTLCNALINPCICRKWAFSSQRACALIPPWRGMGDPRVASPIECEGQRGLGLRHRTGAMRNFRESPKGEVRRKSIPRTLGNRRKRLQRLLGVSPKTFDFCPSDDTVGIATEKHNRSEQRLRGSSSSNGRSLEAG